MSGEEVERLLAQVAADAGGELVVEERHPTLGPVPLPADGFRDGRCPACGGTLFTHEYGDSYATCAACGAEVKPRELI